MRTSFPNSMNSIYNWLIVTVKATNDKLVSLSQEEAINRSYTRIDAFQC